MEVEKRKYKRKEVEKILDDVSAEHQAVLTKQKDRIAELILENKKLLDENLYYKNKEKQLLGVLDETKKQSDKSIEDLRLKYQAEVLALKNFAEKWRGYFEYLTQKYPFYSAVNETVEIKNLLSKIVDESSLKDKMNEVNNKINKSLGDDKFFDPKQKINEYISATSDNGFNIDEVLNPGELELEDLCRELGLIDE